MKMTVTVIIVMDTIHDSPILALNDAENAIHFLLANKDVDYTISSVGHYLPIL